MAVNPDTVKDVSTGLVDLAFQVAGKGPKTLRKAESSPVLVIEETEETEEPSLLESPVVKGVAAGGLLVGLAELARRFFRRRR